MAKRLNTTVHLGNSEDGVTRVLGPKDKLSREDVKELRQRWGKRFDEFVVSDDDDDDESQRESLEAGHGLADSTTADTEAEAVVEAMQIREEARTEANPEGVADSSKQGSKRSSR